MLREECSKRTGIALAGLSEDLPEWDDFKHQVPRSTDTMNDHVSMQEIALNGIISICTSLESCSAR